MLVANAHRPDESKNEPQCHKDDTRDSRIPSQPLPERSAVVHVTVSPRFGIGGSLQPAWMKQ